MCCNVYVTLSLFRLLQWASRRTIEDHQQQHAMLSTGQLNAITENQEMRSGTSNIDMVRASTVQ